ncbi:MAG TPA: hypothetical protein VFF30_16865 [Nitrososphaerales archaeon]|nr:hypothetical protein [Nitrososphaerales archaeon]
MSRGGAPAWVYIQREASMRSSYESQTFRLEKKIEELEAENTKLKRELADIGKKYIDCVQKSNAALPNLNDGSKSPLDKLQHAILRVIDDFNARRFRPNSEADVKACIYHNWLQLYPSDIGLLHVEARIGQIQTKLHSDLAYGKTEDNNEHRPSVSRPLLVSEIKSFWGLTKGQPATRRRDVEKDILALGEESLGATARALIIFDMMPTSKNYLSDGYNRKFLELIKQQGCSISTFIVRFKEGSASLSTNFA